MKAANGNAPAKKEFKSLYQLIGKDVTSIFASYYSKYVEIVADGMKIRFEDGIRPSLSDIECELVERGTITKTSTHAQFHETNNSPSYTVSDVSITDSEIVLSFAKNVRLRIYSSSGRTIITEQMEDVL